MTAGPPTLRPYEKRLIYKQSVVRYVRCGRRDVRGDSSDWREGPLVSSRSHSLKRNERTDRDDRECSPKVLEYTPSTLEL